MRKQSAAATKDAFPYFKPDYFLYFLQNPRECTNQSPTWARRAFNKQSTKEAYKR